MAKSWASDKRPKYGEGVGKYMNWQRRHERVDANGVPLRPFGVHMVCMSAKDAVDGGCGCRMTHEPQMEHNGVSSVGEWHVVTQPHFNCPRGSFRPARFVSHCDASNCPHQCACHVEGSGIDPADCVCKGDWKRLKTEEWVKTTTAPTANAWKDKRAERAQAKAATAAAAR